MCYCNAMHRSLLNGFHFTFICAAMREWFIIILEYPSLCFDHLHLLNLYLHHHHLNHHHLHRLSLSDVLSQWECWVTWEWGEQIIGPTTTTIPCVIFIITRPWPAFGRQGLVGSSGGYTYHGYTSHASPRARGARLGRKVSRNGRNVIYPIYRHFWKVSRNGRN